MAIHVSKDLKQEIFADGAIAHMHEDQTIAAQVANKLHEHYPNHLWAVAVQRAEDNTGGLIFVRNLALPFNFGYVIQLADYKHDPSMKIVIKAGGEILERARLKRGKWNGETATKMDGVSDHEMAKHLLRNGLLQQGKKVDFNV